MSTCGRGRNLQRLKQASSLGKRPLEFSTSSSALTPPPTTTAELSTISYFLSFLLNVVNITKTQTEVMVNRVISSYSWHSFQKRISFACYQVLSLFFSSKIEQDVSWKEKHSFWKLFLFMRQWFIFKGETPYRVFTIATFNFKTYFL